IVKAKANRDRRSRGRIESQASGHREAQVSRIGIYKPRQLSLDARLDRRLAVARRVEILKYPNRKPAATVVFVHAGAAGYQNLRHIQGLAQPILAGFVVEPQKVKPYSKERGHQLGHSIHEDLGRHLVALEQRSQSLGSPAVQREELLQV